MMLNQTLAQKETLLRIINAEQLVQRHLDVETLVTRRSDNLDFYDVGVSSVMRLTREVLSILNRELTDATIEFFVHKHLWDEDEGGIVTRGRDSLDFHDVSVWGLKNYLLDLVDCQSEVVTA